MKFILTLFAGLMFLLLVLSIGLMFVSIAVPSLLTGGMEAGLHPIRGTWVSLFPIVTILMIGLMGIGIAWAAAFAVRRPKKQEKQLDAEETQIVQEVYRGLAAMEKRIEALETILLDRARENREDVRFRS